MTLTMKKCWPGAINAYAQGAGGVAGGMVVGKGTWGFGRDAGGVRQQRGKGVCVCVCARARTRVCAYIMRACALDQGPHW